MITWHPGPCLSGPGVSGPGLDVLSFRPYNVMFRPTNKNTMLLNAAIHSEMLSTILFINAKIRWLIIKYNGKNIIEYKIQSNRMVANKWKWDVCNKYCRSSTNCDADHTFRWQKISLVCALLYAVVVQSLLPLHVSNQLLGYIKNLPLRFYLCWELICKPTCATPFRGCINQEESQNVKRRACVVCAWICFSTFRSRLCVYVSYCVAYTYCSHLYIVISWNTLTTSGYVFWRVKL